MDLMVIAVITESQSSQPPPTSWTSQKSYGHHRYKGCSGLTDTKISQTSRISVLKNIVEIITEINIKNIRDISKI
jgi:hypothetical protein